MLFGAYLDHRLRFLSDVLTSLLLIYYNIIFEVLMAQKKLLTLLSVAGCFSEFGCLEACLWLPTVTHIRASSDGALICACVQLSAPPVR